MRIVFRYLENTRKINLPNYFVQNEKGPSIPSIQINVHVNNYNDIIIIEVGYCCLMRFHKENSECNS